MTKDLVAAIQRIEAQRADALNGIRIHEESLRVWRARLEAFDDALFELNKAAPEEVPVVKVPRLDIAQAVLDRIASRPASLYDLAEAIGRKPSQITAAIKRLDTQIYRADDGLYFLSARAVSEAAQ